MSERPFVMRQRRPPKGRPVARENGSVEYERFPPVPREVHQRVENKLEVARLRLREIIDMLGHAKDWHRDIAHVRNAERVARETLGAIG